MLTIAEIENSEIKSKAVVSTEGNQHGQLPAFLVSKGISVVIAGGMGEGARQKLASMGIEIISGVTGNIDEAIGLYLNGSLKSSNTGCAGHGHSHEHHGGSGCNCGNH
jgi:predicted Fe-Mo cluster-binding NifX family protein